MSDAGKERKGKYWICTECANKQKGWIAPTGAVTAIIGLCGWCKREDEVMLIPVVDYETPERKATWD